MASPIFSIEPNSAFQQFADDGSFAYPWVTTSWACATCHNASFTILPPDLTGSYIFHNNLD